MLWRALLKNKALDDALNTEIVKKRFGELATIAPSHAERTAAHLGQLVPDEVEKYKKLLKK